MYEESAAAARCYAWCIVISTHGSPDMAHEGRKKSLWSIDKMDMWRFAPYRETLI